VLCDKPRPCYVYHWNDTANQDWPAPPIPDKESRKKEVDAMAADIPRPKTTGPPVLPYPEPGGQSFTSGHSGSSTSRDRAVSDDESGVTSTRQRMVLSLLGEMGTEGMVWPELAYVTDWHHGQASGALSNLHKAGRIARLSQVRKRCKVYVLPQYVDGRETEAFGGKTKVREPEV
jgi:hypothetical protein